MSARDEFMRLLGEEQWQEAIDVAQRLVPDFEVALKHALALLQLDRVPEAFDPLDTAFALAQTTNERTMAIFVRGSLWRKMGDLEAAEASFRESLDLADAYPPRLGLAAMLLGCSSRSAPEEQSNSDHLAQAA